jgi:hypothetical protein
LVPLAHIKLPLKGHKKKWTMWDGSPLDFKIMPLLDAAKEVSEKKNL